jgi:hypothetical protein
VTAHGVTAPPMTVVFAPWVRSQALAGVTNAGWSQSAAGHGALGHTSTMYALTYAPTATAAVSARVR